MANQFLSPKLFLRDLLVNFISGLAGGAIVSIFSGNLWLGFLSFGLILVVLLIGRLWKKYERMIKLMLSSNAGYYYSFDLEENPKVWQEAKRSFCYLGVSCDSIMEPLRRWFETTPLSSYRILLMNPEVKAHEKDALMKQEAFQKGHDLDVESTDLPSAVKKAIEESAEATRQRIRGAVSVLKNTPYYKDGRLKIKLYNEFTPWWAYIIDDRKAYIGILEKGKRGSSSPVMVMGKNDQYTSPFDAFKNNWERIWQSAKNA